MRMLTESPLGSDPLGSLERMPYGRDSPSRPTFRHLFYHRGLNLCPAWAGIEV